MERRSAHDNVFSDEFMPIKYFSALFFLTLVDNLVLVSKLDVVELQHVQIGGPQPPQRLGSASFDSDE